MTEAFERGMLLYDQKRWQKAMREFEAALVEAPDHAHAHAYMALCLMHEKNLRAAALEAGRAVESRPDDDFVHYVAAHVFKARRKHDEAMKSIRTALELSPADAHYHGTAANFLTDRQEWQQALALAERGLELDAGDQLCYNVRALALMQLGRSDVAANDLRDRLHEDPEDAVTLATLGWAALHEREYKAAIGVFGEALRIDSELETARTGLLHALSARNPIYGFILRYFIWMGKMKPSQRIGVVAGVYFGTKALFALQRRYPVSAPFVMPLLIVLAIFKYLSWTARSFATAMLSLDRRTRPMLNGREMTQARWTLALVATIAVSTWLWFKLHVLGFLLLALLTPFALIPLSCMWGLTPGKTRRIMGAATAPVLAIGLVSVLSAFIWGDVELTQKTFFFFLGCQTPLQVLGNILMSIDEQQS